MVFDHGNEYESQWAVKAARALSRGDFQQLRDSTEESLMKPSDAPESTISPAQDQNTSQKRHKTE